MARLRVRPGTRTVAVFLSAVLLLFAPVSMHAWGMDVHRLLTRRALDELPPDLKPFFAEQRDFISEHAADPDLWRVVNLKGDLGTEDPNHHLDLDALAPPPFGGVPREWEAYVAKFGLEKANQMGRLPWRADEMYNRLVSLFQDIARATGSGYAPDNARYVASVLSHYVEDAHVPFHATGNYDGQLTNQRGIHARFETDLVRRNLATLNFAPVKLRPLSNFREFMFETLIESQSLVGKVLEADRTAAGGREFYDDAYYAAFFSGARPILEKRMSDSVAAVASVIVSAWEKAGKPKLPLAGARPPVRIRR